MEVSDLDSVAIASVELNGRFSHAAVYNSNCECGDSDGCDGDCGGDCNDVTCPSGGG